MLIRVKGPNAHETNLFMALRNGLAGLRGREEGSMPCVCRK